MAELTIYAESSDGDIFTQSATYSLARSGTGATAGNTTVVAAGQSLAGGSYYCFEAFLQYDTSNIDGTITAVSEFLYLSEDHTTTNYTEEVRAYDWGSTLTSADFVAGANLGNYTLLSSKTVSPSAGYNEFASSDNFIAAINRTGNTRLIHNSDRHRAGTTPTGTEYVLWLSADNSGTTSDPKLVITYAPAPAIITFDSESNLSIIGDTFIPLLFLQEPTVTTRSPIATHITVASPTNWYDAHIAPEPAESTRVERLVNIEAGNATVCQAVAEELIARWGRVQLSISGVISLETRLDFDTKVRVVIPRAGIDGIYPVQRRENDIFSRTTTLSMGDISLSDNELIARLLQDLLNK